MSINSVYSYFNSKVRMVYLLVKSGNLIVIANAIGTRFNSSITSVGLLRNLDEDFPIIKPDIDLKIRLFKENDLNTLDENYRHIGFINQNIPDCYTIVTDDNIPCFRMWLMKSSENQSIRNYFGGLFPILKPDEAIIEGVFTNPSYRRMGIMPYIMNTIAQQSKSEGVNKVISFVDIENIPSLKGFHRSGFSPYIVRKVKWKFFNRTINFEPLDNLILNNYKENTTSNVLSIPINVKGVIYL